MMAKNHTVVILTTCATYEIFKTRWINKEGSKKEGIMGSLVGHIIQVQPMMSVVFSELSTEFRIAYFVVRDVVKKENDSWINKY
jgi:hypothetical protein